MTTTSTVSAGQTSTGLTIVTGETLTVNSGGKIVSATINAGGVVSVLAGGVDSSTVISSGGNETILGSAWGDQISGTQLVSAATAVVTSETVFNGGVIDLYLKGAVATGTTVMNGGAINVSGNATVSNTTLNGGGTLRFQSPKAVALGSLNFVSGGNTLAITAATSAGYGVSATISGFLDSDKIDIAAGFNSAALALSETVSGGNTIVNVVSGGAVVGGVVTGGINVETFTFAGTSLFNDMSLVSDNNGGVDLEITPLPGKTIVSTPTAPGAYTEAAGFTLDVRNGGSVSAATIQSGGVLVVNGGVDAAAVVLAGGVEIVSAGSASGDRIYGVANVSGGAVSGETVFGGGQINVSAGATVSNIVLSGGGLLDLASPTATISGTLTFAGGGNTLEAGALANDGFGDLAEITGFQTNDKIEVTGIGSSGATLTFASDGAGGEIATISGATGSESFRFADATAYNASTMALANDGTGVDLVLKTTPVVTFTSLGGFSNKATQTVNGMVNTAVDPEAIGSTVSISEGSTVLGTATVGANGYWSANVGLLNSSGANVLTASVTDAANQTGVTSQSLTYNIDTTAPAFTAGNLVISISGDGDGSGVYGDNQAAPITLEQITTSGAYVSQLVLPTTTSVVNGVTEYGISGEYGSSSEGTLELSADGHSLVIAGYGVNYATYNAGGAAVYGNAAEAQSTSEPGGTYTAVPRVIADISASGAVDTSTALYNVFNTNNPRSVATVDGKEFWVAGQGDKNANGVANQGLFYAVDGASSATGINTSIDMRTAMIFNGQLYVSTDSKQGVPNISNYGATTTTDTTTAVTTATTPVVLTGLSTSVTLTGANGNTVNAVDSVGSSVNLSPESYFFASSGPGATDDILYVADGGAPKLGGLGDGGLQKWVFDGTQWNLAYTLSAGLNLIPNTNTGSSGDTGLIGLTGQVNADGTVQLYATTEPLGDLGKTAVVSITDTLSATSGTGESFTTIYTASAGENIRGIAFAPTASSDTICFMAGTLIRTPQGEAPVETLQRGDLVLTSDGAVMPVTWLGKQTVAAAFADRVRSWPIRVKAGALDENVPCRDLLLSPDHALLVDGALIHAGALVNGTSIVRETKVEPIFVYYHVELDDHSLILAENTPAETFIDNVERLNFDNWAEHEALYPNGKAIDELALPRAKGRRQVPMQVRAKLDARAQMIGETETQAVA